MESAPGQMQECKGCDCGDGVFVFVFIHYIQIAPYRLNTTVDVEYVK